MSFLQEAVLRRYFGFLLGFLALLTGFGIFCGTAWVRAEQEVLLAHDRAFASSLLEEDVPPVAIVRALRQAQETELGAVLLGGAGRLRQAPPVGRTAARGHCSALTALFFRLSSPPWMSGPSMRNICASPPEIAAGYLRRVQGYAPPPAPASARSRVPVRFPR